jgi:AraC family transcriptional regulator
MTHKNAHLTATSPTTQRLARAIAYIEQHLTDDVRLIDISNIACLSHYHFMRTFHAITGMPIGTYIRRRRLSQAADQLSKTSDRIIDIAFNSGFESQAAFTRAFKEYTGVTPSIWRHHSPDFSDYQHPLTSFHLIHLTKGKIMTPQFTDRDAFTIMGVGDDFMPFDSDNIGKLWDRFLEQRPKINATNGTLAYGICDGPKKTPSTPDQFHYTAGIVVTPDINVPNGMEKMTIPAAHYAVFTHTGSIKNLPKTIEYIWKDWLPNSGYTHANSPDFEEYDDRFKGDDPTSLFDIYIPIQK